ncbi:MAG: nucleotidyltransferase family protein, partial [Acidobacteriaceae bacterium]|nr:nucleotidyltransferase family protein [Acidobacteriaceae bacterium]MBV9294437.1 nucleotidyltransferase family protein [Acidobacteriaceae bacterium]
MGSLKQLLSFRGRTLLEHAVQQTLAAGFHPVIVVVGAEAPAIRNAIAAQPVEIVQNDEWRSGMGSSIAAGIRKLREMDTDSAAVAILAADQPLITADHLAVMRKLLHTAGPPIIAAQYNGIAGIPALFKRELFATLAGLAPETGARDL